MCRTTTATAVTVLLVLLVLLQTGCFSYHAARGEPPRARSLSPSIWPDISTSLVAELAEETPPLIVELALDAAGDGGAADPETMSRMIDERSWRVPVVRIGAHGLLRTWDVVARRMNAMDLMFLLEGFEPTGSFLTDPSLTAVRQRSEHVERARREAGAESFEVPAPPGFRLTGDSPGRWFLRSGIRLRPPEIAGDEIGVVVHIPALIGNEYERAILDRLAADGWAIAHLGSDITLRDSNGPARAAAQQRISLRTGEIYRERVPDPNRQRDGAIWKAARAAATAEIGIPDSGFAFHAGGDPDAHGRKIAAAADLHLAEHAYAAEALVDLVDEALPDRPLVVVGFSAGALLAPTVTARLRAVHRDRVRGLVMVGGGGDLLSIALTSDVSDGGIVLAPQHGAGPSDVEVEQIRRAYRAHSVLDALALAPALSDLPVLHAYARHDGAVPTSAAVEFNETHGHVDRLVHGGGHRTLFYFLPGEAKRIARWVDALMPPTAGVVSFSVSSRPRRGSARRDRRRRRRRRG